MPIIRYRTGDMGELDGGDCPCGRSPPLLKRVEGRRTDFLVTPRGRIIHALGAIYVLREVPTVREFQVIQQATDRVRVDVVPEPAFSDQDAAVIERRLRTLMGEEVAVSVQLTDQIRRAPSGKFRYVISEIADGYLEGILSGDGARPDADR
jgi:phenylacetate-CoA ligase